MACQHHWRLVSAALCFVIGSAVAQVSGPLSGSEKAVARQWVGGALISWQPPPIVKLVPNPEVGQSAPAKHTIAVSPPLSPVNAAGVSQLASPPAPAIMAAARVPSVVVGIAQAGLQRVLSLDVVVNGVKSGTWLFIEYDGLLYAPRDAFEDWRVQLAPGAMTIDFKGQPYSPLSTVPGFKAKIDFPNQAIELLFSPEVFSAQRLAQEIVKRPVVSPVLPSVFLNYDLNYAASSFRNLPSSRDLGLLTELGMSNAWGVLTSSQTVSNLISNGTVSDLRRWRRLETTFTRDFPAENRTLRLGDTATRAGMWGRNAYFGGIQFGSNFALSPGFIRQPLPVLRGLSAAPSTVELYVNDVLRQVSSVPTGPFALDNFPVMTGSGETRLVVRDILGRETVIVQSFLTSGQLLAPGLSDWSVEAGSLRRNLGTVSNEYGNRFASGTWSRGFSESVTIEGRAEMASRLRTAGVGLVLALPGQLLGKIAAVASRDDEIGNGNYWLVGLERQGLRTSLSFDIRGASRNFRQLGQETSTKPVKLQFAGNMSWSLGESSIGLGFANIAQHDDARVSTVSANFSTRIGARSNLTLTASRAVAGASGTAVGMTVLMQLEENRIISGSANHHNGQSDFYLAASQNPAVETGLGWRVLAGQQQNQSRAEGGSYYLGRYGRVSNDVSLSPDQKALRLGATGGLVLADGNFFATRRVDDSFAVAEIKGYGDIGIGLGSNVLTRTDANGVALIPRLVPYQNNSVRVDPTELPINAEIDSIEQSAVPPWRSAVKVSFPVRSGRGALIKIVLDDNEVAPAGALVNIEGDAQEFYVARRGEAFVTGLKQTDRIILKWSDQQCSVEVRLQPEVPNEIARVGPLQCKGLKR